MKKLLSSYFEFLISLKNYLLFPKMRKFLHPTKKLPLWMRAMSNESGLRIIMKGLNMKSFRLRVLRFRQLLIESRVESRFPWLFWMFFPSWVRILLPIYGTAVGIRSDFSMFRWELDPGTNRQKILFF